MTKGTLGMSPGLPWPWPAPGVLWLGGMGKGMVRGTSGFPVMAHRLTQGSCSRCVGHLSAVPRGSSPLLHAGGKWASQRQTAKRVEVLSFRLSSGCSSRRKSAPGGTGG